MLKRSKAPVQRLSEENLGWTTGSSKEIKFIDQEQSVKDMPESNHDNISMQVVFQKLSFRRPNRSRPN